MTSFKESNTPDVGVGANFERLAEHTIRKISFDKDALTEEDNSYEGYLQNPLTRLHFDPETERHQLTVNIMSQPDYELDTNNALGIRIQGENIFLFINYKGNEHDTNDDSNNLNFITVDFRSQFNEFLSNKNVYVIPVFGDPEEGGVSHIPLTILGEIIPTHQPS